MLSQLWGRNCKLLVYCYWCWVWLNFSCGVLDVDCNFENYSQYSVFSLVYFSRPGFIRILRFLGTSCLIQVLFFAQFVSQKSSKTKTSEKPVQIRLSNDFSQKKRGMLQLAFKAWHGTKKWADGQSNSVKLTGFVLHLTNFKKLSSSKKIIQASIQKLIA